LQEQLADAVTDMMMMMMMMIQRAGQVERMRCEVKAVLSENHTPTF
jgi:hypothetical protein